VKTIEFESYELFLQNFVDAGYSFKTFENFEHGRDRQAIIRHDVDFDIDLAHDMAQIEIEIVKATYFFWITNNFYNILSKDAKSGIEDIALYHDVKIHLNADNYFLSLDIGKGIHNESLIFSMLFDHNVHSLEPFSIHKPLKKSLHKYLGNLDHTYKGRWFRDIKYISDSKGFFREGNPFESDWFKEGRSCQCAIHPIWWMQEGDDPVDKIRNWITKKNKQLIKDVSENSEPYREYMEGL
jgi:hypothetical protein